jgi:hypothetical protein
MEVELQLITYQCGNQCNSPSVLFNKSQLSASHCTHFVSECAAIVLLLPCQS